LILQENFLSFKRKLLKKFNYPSIPSLIFNSENEESNTYSHQTLYNLGFFGGWVGFFGYELHEETLEKPLFCKEFKLNKKVNEKNNIDALWFLADQTLIFDHFEKKLILACLCNNEIESINLVKNVDLEVFNTNQGKKWIFETKERLEEIIEKKHSEIFHLMIKKTKEIFKFVGEPKEKIINKIEQFMRNSHDSYIEKIERCKEIIKDGDSYELCLTTQFTLLKEIEDFIFLEKKIPFAFLCYLSLRNNNPAPFSLYFHVENLDLRICCSSPEEFLRIYSEDHNNHFKLRMKPVKGTICRDLNNKAKDEDLKQALLNSEKDKSENLMVFFF